MSIGAHHDEASTGVLRTAHQRLALVEAVGRVALGLGPDAVPGERLGEVGAGDGAAEGRVLLRVKALLSMAAKASRGAAFSPKMPRTALPMTSEPAIPATQVVSSQR